MSKLQTNTYLAEAEFDSVSNDSTIQRWQVTTSLTQLFRLVGACAVIASMSLFMLEGWSEGNDIQRYLKLLGQTGLLITAGLVLSYVLKEYKGARLFFGLSLSSVVANFTILGALIYSMFQLDGALLQYPAMATWVAVDAKLFWPLATGAIALLALLSRFSFSIFSRSIAGSLTVWFLLLNSLVLVPVRSSLSVSILLVVGLAGAILATKRLLQNEELVLTLETKFALSTLFFPSVIIAARAISFYHIDEVLMLTLSSLAYLALHLMHRSINMSNAIKCGIQLKQIALGFTIAGLIVSLLPIVIDALQPAIFSLIMLAITLDLVKQSSDTGWQSFVYYTSIILLTTGNVLLAFWDNGLKLPMGSLLVCTAILFSNSLLTNIDTRKSRLIAIIGIALCLWFITLDLIQLAHLSSWVIFGIVGITLILGASLYERYGLRIFRHSQ